MPPAAAENTVKPGFNTTIDPASSMHALNQATLHRDYFGSADRRVVLQLQGTVYCARAQCERDTGHQVVVSR